MHSLGLASQPVQAMARPFAWNFMTRLLCKGHLCENSRHEAMVTASPCQLTANLGQNGVCCVNQLLVSK